MARPAFRTTYYQNYPPPFYPGASGQYPVPGWGVRPVMAGPARVGVGAAPAPSVTASPAAMVMRAPTFVTGAKPPSPKKPFPWWALFTVAGIAGGGLALAYNYKLIGKRR